MADRDTTSTPYKLSADAVCYFRYPNGDAPAVAPADVNAGYVLVAGDGVYDARYLDGFDAPRYSNVWYVSYSTGLDTNDGSIGSPFKTPNKAVSVASRGDIIYLYATDVFHQQVDGQAVLSVNVDGLTIDGGSWGVVSQGDKAQLFMDGHASIDLGTLSVVASDVVIRDIDVHMNFHTGSGINIGTSATRQISNVLLHRCVVHDGVDDLGTLWGYGINTTSKSTKMVRNVTYLECIVRDHYGEGMSFYTTWNVRGARSEDCSMLACEAYNCNTGFSIVNDAYGIVLENCYWHDNNKEGGILRVSPLSEGGYGDVPNTDVFDGPRNVSIRGNIFAHNGQNGFVYAIGKFVGFDFDCYNNLIFNTGLPTPYGVDALEIAHSLGIQDNHFPNSFARFWNNTIYSEQKTVTNKYNLVSIIVDGSDIVLPLGLIADFSNNLLFYDNAGDARANAWVLLDRWGVFEVPGATHNNNYYWRDGDAARTSVFANYNPVEKGDVTVTRSELPLFEPTCQSTAIPTLTGGTLPSGFTGQYGTHAGMVPNTDFFKPTSGCLSIGNAMDLSNVFTTDIAGIARSGAWTIGAYHVDAP